MLNRVGFNVYKFDGSNETSFLAILNRKVSNGIWIGNRDTPILYPSPSVLTLDRNNTLKIIHQGRDPIVISSAPQTTSNISTISVVVATILNKSCKLTTNPLY